MSMIRSEAISVAFRAGALLAASAAAAALAMPAAEPVHSQRVRTADLDLASLAGQRTLDLRILHAASALCGIPSSADPRGRARHAACRAEVRAQTTPARQQALTAARDRTGERTASMKSGDR